MVVAGDTDREREHDTLVAAAAGGDPDAVRALILDLEPALIRYAARRGAADPEGVSNLVLSRTINRLPQLHHHSRASLCAYLYRSADNQMASEARARRVRPELEFGTIDSEMADPGSSSFADRVADADAAARLLDGLTDDQRDVLRLRFLEDLSLEETADRTGKPVTAVKALQRRALARIRLLAVGAVAVLVLAVVLAIQARNSRVEVDLGPAEPIPTTSSIAEPATTETLAPTTAPAEVDGSADAVGGTPASSAAEGGETTELVDETSSTDVSSTTSTAAAAAAGPPAGAEPGGSGSKPPPITVQTSTTASAPATTGPPPSASTTAAPTTRRPTTTTTTTAVSAGPGGFTVLDDSYCQLHDTSIANIYRADVELSLIGSLVDEEMYFLDHTWGSDPVPFSVTFGGPIVDSVDIGQASSVYLQLRAPITGPSRIEVRAGSYMAPCSIGTVVSAE